MRMLLSLTLLGLAWFAAVNVAATALAWLAARGLLRSDRPNPDVLALVRLAPSIAATLFVLVLFVPGHLRLEPVDSDESFGLLFVVLTLLSAALLVRALRRTIVVVSVARRARKALGASGTALNPNADDRVTKVYELEGFSGLSLAGVFRSQIFVGVGVRRALTSDELELAIAHEHAHDSWRDNLTRCAMFCAPDLLGWSSTARALERRWRAEAECRADSDAVAGDERRAVLLASALVKVARLSGERNPLSSPAWSAFHEPMLLEARVRRLLSGAAFAFPSRRLNVPVACCFVLAFTAAGSALGAATEVHRLTEILVALLP